MFVLRTIHNLNSKVPEKQCIHAAKSCNCYVFMYQDAFRFFVLLKNMLFCYSLLAATNHKTYQQIERSNNFFQKKIAHHWRYGRSPCGEKKPPGRMRGISFVSQTGWWRRGESNSRPKTLPWELLRAQTVIAGVSLSLFPSPWASRHAQGSGELHDSWPAQSFAGARSPLNDAQSRLVVLPGWTAAFN